MAVAHNLPRGLLRDEQLVVSLAERMDRLQAQLDQLNEALRRHLGRRRRRKLSSAAQLASFRKQARKLANHAPS